MRIGFNMAALRGYGSSAVGRALWREFARLGEGDELVAWVAESWLADARSVGGRAKLYGARGGVLGKLWTENVLLRGGLVRHRIDKLFSLGDTSLPLTRLPHLLLVQLAYLAVPASKWGFEVSRAFRARMRLIELNFAAVLPTVHHLTVQTEFVKRGLSERWGIAPERITVVPSSVEPWLRELSHAPSSDDPYICYVASASPHKNHTLLAQLMARLVRRHPGLRCRLTVHREEVPALIEQARALNVLNAFTFEPGLSHRAAIEMTRGAVAAVIPSKLESFGLPYYEAMAVGCPVVAADLPFAREACGAAGLYAHPDDADAFAEHVEHLLEHDVAKRQSDAVRERFNSVYLPWADVGRAYWRILETL